MYYPWELCELEDIFIHLEVGIAAVIHTKVI